jgi:hypothetical protein
VVVADLDGDRVPDLVTADSNSRSVSVLLGKGDGSFQGGAIYRTGLTPYSVAVADLDGDRIPDLATANAGSDDVTVLLGRGDGSFRAAIAFAVGTRPYSVAVADLDDDNVADLVTANARSDNVSVLLGNRDGSFQPASAYGVGWAPQSVAAADLNGDGVVDIATANAGNDVSVLLNLRDPAMRVGIDIKPDSDSNSINPSLEGDLPVAIFGSDSFDVADVDVTTLAFGPGGAPLDHRNGPHVKDLNRDGFKDLVAHFRIEEAGIAFGDREVCLTGKTLDGARFKGCDAVRTVPDTDGDTLLDVEEAALGTSALNWDTDGDGYGDGQEVHLMGTDPLDSLDPPPVVTRSEPRRPRSRR